MRNDLRKLLAELREAAKTEREKGTYFERLAIAFIKHDPGMVHEYEDAWLYAEWAKDQGIQAKDLGIDAVAKLRSGGFCAIQCKFYAESHKLRAEDLNGFLAASSTGQFERRLFIDTTNQPLSENLEHLLVTQQVPTTRIGLDRLDGSPVDWAAFLLRGEIKVAAKKDPLPHQLEALDCTRDGFAKHDRGKLIMACGTGKTFTALTIALELVGPGKSVLFLVPSLSLMSQSVREWTIDAKVPLRSFAVCSDAQVGKRRRQTDDVAEIEVHDLDYPATTNASKLAARASAPSPDRMTVVFATYQSIQVISEAQKQHGLPEFDLIICDEAHRTTGATFPGEDQSNFVRVHDQEYLRGRKRLYMTATPRVFGEVVKAKASEASVELSSMDNEALYGPYFFTRGFGWAVEQGLLTDYKVIVLAVDEEMVSASIQSRLADAENELKLDDATKIVGCYKALTKAGLKEDVTSDPEPMHRALAFCRDIASSKLICDQFKAVVQDYLASEEGQQVEEGRTPLACDLKHVDGTFNAKLRTERLDWLKAKSGEDDCRILTNARCLSEGVDVPALDAILFLHPRKSQIDVVQSVGRVMRRAPGKRMGYVILPIGVPAGATPEEALNDNERYRVVWQILNALRSHDERFDDAINKMGMDVDVSAHIEVVAVSNKLPTRSDPKKSGAGIGQGSATGDDERDQSPSAERPVQQSFVFDEFAKAIMAKIVKKVGRRDYWENWASDIAEIARTHITRITAIVGKAGSKEQEAFQSFLAEIRDDLNDSITEPEAIEMLAQHIITKPVFEALFSDHSFAANNPVSVAMQSVLDVLQEQNLEKEAESLERFYDSVRRRASGIDTAEAKQRIIVELYDKFFRTAFPRMTEKLGIVYTPVEIVDFIIRSVDEVLRSEFNQTLGSPGVHIIDPFTGTGTFITRLLQSGLISPAELAHKYREELHANEIVLLAYYIAAINIEAVYASMTSEFEPFRGICLTDTFQLYEKRDLVSGTLAENSSRRTRQRSLPLRVIIGNPPYSVGQRNENDNAANVSYAGLDERIRQTYVQKSSATNSRNLYDSYVRALRWASDRVADTGGVVAFITNAGWIDTSSADGIRRSLADEFTSVYVVHLRGNQRTQGEVSRREGGKVFGQGSRAPVAVTILVKNPSAPPSVAQIRMFDIGDYLSREEKLLRLREFGSLSGLSNAGAWTEISPDQHGDWVGQREESYDSLIPLSDKKGGGLAFFEVSSLGVATNRDSWCVNSSPDVVAENIEKLVATYESERRRLTDEKPLFSSSMERATYINGFALSDPTRISWSRSLKSDLGKLKPLSWSGERIRGSVYRPFTRQWFYFDRRLNEMVYQMPRIYPYPDATNLCIASPGTGFRPGYSCIATNAPLDLNAFDGGAHHYPKYIYEEMESQSPDLFSKQNPGRRDNITDAILQVICKNLKESRITKDDIFSYVYGVLSARDFRSLFEASIRRQGVRLPLPNSMELFEAFSSAGRKLIDLHSNFDSVEPYPITLEMGRRRPEDSCDTSFYRVEQMKFAGKRPNVDKTTVIYNSNITMTDIPLEAYDYVVNGKSALEWIMERQVVKTDKDSGIVNDANRYAVETVGDPAYPLKLFQRVITVSLETMKIVRSLPPLDILEDGKTAQAEAVH